MAMEFKEPILPVLGREKVKAEIAAQSVTVGEVKAHIEMALNEKLPGLVRAEVEKQLQEKGIVQ